MLLPGALLTFTAATALWEALATRREAERFPAPGRLVDVGGHRLHAQVREGGEPTVVLEGGAGEWSTHWGQVPGRLSRFARVIAYDRAGLGWSELGPRPRTCSAMADELHRLLEGLGVDGPVVLVAHSFGALVARSFTARYPERVSGLVFVDGYAPGFEARTREAGLEMPSMSPRLLRALGLLQRTGWPRLFDRLMAWRSATGPALPFPPEVLPALAAVGSQPRVIEGLARELEDADAAEEEVRALPAQVPVPLRLIVSPAPLGADEPLPRGFSREAYNRLWLEAGMAQCTLSADAQAVVAERSDHLVQLREPERVEDVVRKLLLHLRESRGRPGMEPGAAEVGP
jgi:pimeloyl-ACP methyl ester carboxylesterase